MKTMIMKGTVGAEASMQQNCTKRTFKYTGVYDRKSNCLIISMGCVLQTWGQTRSGISISTKNTSYNYLLKSII